MTATARPDIDDDLTGLKICIIGMHYKPETTGNAPYTTAMAWALADAGAQVHVITGIPHYPQWRIDDPKYLSGSYWREQDGPITVSRCRHAVPKVPNFLGRLRMEAGFFRRVARVARADKSDILICVTPMLSGLAAGLLRRRGRPLGVLVQDLTGNAAGESGSTGGRAARLIAKIEYSLLGRCDLVGVITPRFRALLSAQHIPEDKIVDLPNFTHITPSTVSVEQARRALGWDLESTLVVHTGNIGRKQGLELVVQAAALAAEQDADVRFVVVGDGNQKQELQALAGSNSHITFIPPVDAQQYPLVLAAADFLLICEKPGVKEMSLPSKLTSYCAAGRPIIAAVEPGGITHELLEAAAVAKLSASGNAQALIDVVSDLHGDKISSVRLARAAHMHFEQHLTPASAHARYRAVARTLAASAGWSSAHTPLTSTQGQAGRKYQG